MDWVKSTVDYYNVGDLATGTDAMEVMFKRGDALAGKLAGQFAQDGFIPDAFLPQLTRRPAQARKIADQLVKTGLWARVRGGYLIVDWVEINAEAVRLAARKRRDRERKRADRAASVDTSADGSVDGPADSPTPCPEESLLDHQSKTKKQKAAAATRAARDPDDLPPAVAILRSALDARKLIVRWDKLTDDELAEIEELVEIHGDSALVKSALAAYQPNKPPVYAKAWLGGWRQIRTPDQGLGLVESCPEPGHSGTTRHCAQCASEQKAAQR